MKRWGQCWLLIVATALVGALTVRSAWAGVRDNVYGYNANRIIQVDLTTGAGTTIYTFSPALSFAAGLAQRPSDGMIFLMDGGNGNDWIYRWDPSNPGTPPVLLGTTGGSIPYMPRWAFSTNGTLYAIDQTTSYIYTVDQNTGAATRGPALTGGPNAGGDFAIGPDGILYMVAANGLYTIPPGGGAVTFLGTVTGITGNLPGLAFDAAGRMLVCNDATPAQVYVLNPATRVATPLSSTLGSDSGDLASVPTPLADLGLTKVGPAGVALGSNVTYTITLTNAGPTAATNVLVTDTLPLNVTFISATGGGVTNGSGQVVWGPFASFAAGAIVNYNLTVGAPAFAATLTNRVSVSTPTTDPNPGDNTATAITLVAPVTDVSLAKTGPASVLSGANLTYSITVTNNGPGTATNIVVTDTLPAGAAFVSATGGGTTNGSGQVVWGPIGSLGAGLTTSFSLTATATDSSGILTNLAVASSANADPNTNNNASTALTTIIPLAGITNNGASCAITNNASTLSWPHTVTNGFNRVLIVHVSMKDNNRTVNTVTYNGQALTQLGRTSNNRAVEMWILVNPPVGTYPVAISLSGNTDIVGGAENFAGVDQAIPTRAYGGANGNSSLASVSVTSSNGDVVVDAIAFQNGATPLSPVSPQALLDQCSANGVIGGSSSQPGLPSSTTMQWTLNNKQWSIAAVALIPAKADVIVTKTGATNVLGGASLTYTITATNAGPSTAVALTLVDTLPPSATFSNASNGGVFASGAVTWPVLSSLASNAAVSYTVTVTAPGSGSLTNIASGAATTIDPVASNNNGVTNAAQVFTTVTPLVADLAVTKTGPASVNAASNMTYTITVTNRGPATATSVVVTDQLPASVTFVGASAGGTTNATGAVYWSPITNFVSGATSNFTVTITAPAVGILTNSAVVGSPVTDSTLTNNVSAPVITTVTPLADLAVIKTGTNAVLASSNLVYSITVTNLGPSPATSVVVTDTLPPAVTFLSATGGGTTNASGAVFWPAIATFASGASTNFTVTIRAPATGILTNTALVGSPTLDPSATNNVTPPVISTVTDQADLQIFKTGSNTVFATSNLVYTITVTNAGPSTAASLVVTDNLPAAATFISATPAATTNDSNQAIWSSLGNLSAGRATNLSLTIKAPATGILTNTAVATSPTPDPVSTNNLTPPVISTVTPLADLVVTKTGPASVSATNQFSYAIAVTNNGPSTATSLVVTDTLPVNVTFLSATGGGTTNASGSVFWSVSNLASGAFTNLGVTVRAPATGIISNSAVVGSPIGDPTPGNNSFGPVVTTVNGLADLGLTKSGPGSVSATNSFGYTLTVTNAGPSTATSVVVTDSLPANVTFLSATGGGVTNASNQVIWSALGNLAVGTSTNLGITVRAPATGVITNSAVVGSTTSDPSSGNNSAGPIITTVNDQADLIVTKTGPASVNATNQFSYAIAVTNNGPSTAVSVVVTDALPANVTFLSATGGGTTNASGSVFWSVSNLASGAFTNLGVTVRAPATGIISNSVVVGSPIGDPTPGNNSFGPVVTTVNGLADLGLTKSGPGSVSATNSFSYTLTVTNAGPSTAASVVVTDSLPVGVTFLSATGGGATNGSGQVVWSALGNLAAGASTNLGLTVRAPAAGILTNTAVVVSPTPDPTPGDNTTPPVITTIDLLADLATFKTAPASVAASANFDYSITITNSGPSTAVSVVVTDVLPAAVSFVSATGGGATNGSGVVVWSSLGNLVAGASTNLTITVKAPASGSITNTAIAGSATTDPTPGNNTSPPAITVINALADLAIFKSGSNTVLAANNLTYSITVTNLGPSTAASVTVTDQLPASVTFVSATGGASTNAGNAVIWSGLGNLAAGAVTNLSLIVKAPGAGILTNFAFVASPTPDPTGTNDLSGPVITTVTPVADLAATKTGPANAFAGSNVVYTITVTNFGPSAATSVVVTDVLPATVTFVSATGGGATNASGAVFWPVIASLAGGAGSNFTVVVTANAVGTLTNRILCGAATVDPVPANNDGTDPAAVVITSVGGFNVTGYAYNDVNKNSQKDSGEAGTGLALWTKLIPTGTPSGPATRVASVNATNGAYILSSVAPGNYTIILDDNSNPADITPTIPAGWLGTEVPNQTRLNVVVLSADVPNQNFGLTAGARLTGSVFVDAGTGSGTANDGQRNGGEAGLPGVTVRLTDSSGGTVYDAAVTDGAGNYSLVVPGIGGTLKIVSTNLTGYISTGGSVGSTGGSYDRPATTVTFANVLGASFSGVDFGAVPVNTFVPDNQQSALPGAVLFYAHTFVAGSAGQVTFSNAAVATPNVPGWSQLLFVDANCNATLDAAEAQITGPITVAAGQKICILVKEIVPANAPLNAQDLVTVTAAFTYTGATPALAAVTTHTDLTLVGTGTSAGLNLLKSVDKATALPGETITYTIVYNNASTGALTNIVINDVTPAYTTFVAANASALPQNLSGVNINVPSVGGSGSITWQFTGTLAPANTGTISFQVKIAQ